MKSRQTNKPKLQDTRRGKTNARGQNPKAKDTPDHDENHDESRRNMYDPEVAKGMQGSGKKQ